MYPRGRNLIIINSVIIIIFSGFAFMMAYMCFVFSGPEGIYLIAQMGATELIESIPGMSVEDVLNAFHILGMACVAAGLYQLLLGVLGLVFAKNSKKAPLLIGLGAIALIAQSLLVLLLMFSNFSVAMAFGAGLIVYALFITGAIGNLRPGAGEPVILGPSSAELMAEIVMVDEGE